MDRFTSPVANKGMPAAWVGKGAGPAGLRASPRPVLSTHPTGFSSEQAVGGNDQFLAGSEGAVSALEKLFHLLVGRGHFS